jgi:hypothetical protein
MQDAAGTRKISANYTTGNEINNCKKIFWRYFNDFIVDFYYAPSDSIDCRTNSARF